MRFFLIPRTFLGTFKDDYAAQAAGDAAVL